MENEEYQENQGEDKKIEPDVKKDNIETPAGNIEIVKTTDITEKGVTTLSAEVNYSASVGGVSIDAGVSKSDDTLSHNETISYNSSSEIINLQAQISDNDGELGYNIDADTTSALGGGLNGTAKLHSDNNDSSITLKVSKKSNPKNLINPDNPMDVNNHDKVRKEELVESGDRVSVESKVGYSKERDGLYTEDSIIYRVNDNNFLKANLAQSSSTSELTTSADLKNVKIDFTNSKNKDGSFETVQNSFNTLLKGKNNQFSIVFTGTNEKNTETSESNRKFELSGGAQLNRNEFGEFQSGFNAGINGALKWDESGLSGYGVNFDGAYNRYGSENGSDKDYLLRCKMGFEKDGTEKNFYSSVFASYRTNNCRTIVEPSVYYNSTTGENDSLKSLCGGLGVYQQVGKNYGDATLYAKMETGKHWSVTDGQRSSNPFSELLMGGNIKATSKLSLDTTVRYNTENKWSGDVTFRYSL